MEELDIKTAIQIAKILAAAPDERIPMILDVFSKAQVGKLIVFETSDSRILNFTDYQRTISANWAKHERIGKKPQSEFLNPELMTVQFKVVLNAQHGVKPWKTFHEITKAVQQGRVEKGLFERTGT